MGVFAAALTASVVPPSGFAQGVRPSIADSFRLGDSGPALCQAQSLSISPAISGMFDRAFAVVCRDAARPVGHVYVLRKGADDPVQRLARLRADDAVCPAPVERSVTDLGPALVSDCKLTGVDVGYQVVTVDRGASVYVAEGLTGYDSALMLALRSILVDRVLPGEVSIAVTSAGASADFARVQAGFLDGDQALAEGYRRNASGDFAQAAEFFNSILNRPDDGLSAGVADSLAGHALQKSNLGEFAQADAAFAQLDAMPTADPEAVRQRRNFRVLHLINQGKLDEAQARLDAPIDAAAALAPVRQGAEIDQVTSAALRDDNLLARRLGGSSSVLTPGERVAVLDAQAMSLAGVIQRLKGQNAQGQATLQAADDALVAVRGGQVGAIMRLRAQIFSELAVLAERRGDFAAADEYLRQNVAILNAGYPGSAATNAARARYAAYLGRRGDRAPALALYRDVVTDFSLAGGASGMESLLSPYFELLIETIPNDPGAVAEIFRASETLVRPGVADTQAALTRELSGGSDEASRLFRQALTLTRDIEATSVETARLRALAEPTVEEQAALSTLTRNVTQMRRDQAATQAALAEFPRYRAIGGGLTLSGLQASLRPGEVYLKLAAVGDDVYAIFATRAEATAWKSPVSVAALDTRVDALRETISTLENGQVMTYPFDVAQARSLYVDLFGPVSARMTNVRHLIFEPDGAMLRLPVGLLITEQAGVAAYNARIARPGADEFDFTGIAWLGRGRQISTAVSAKGFVDVRATPLSQADKAYLGLGQNAPLNPTLIRASLTRSASLSNPLNCDWPASTWNAPISDSELRLAGGLIGARGADLVTGAAFTDVSVTERDDLSDYRIIHFATHGLVTASKPGCPARPALLTSFGPSNSDGLLTFLDVYNLRLDADLIILSACDTAGTATVAATREAGVTTGGGSALDGLVRAFIGAGARSVVASHWPAPDQFDATARLIGGLFEAEPGTSVGEALQRAEGRLMDDPLTSHPYYWAGFSVIGDAAQPVIRVQ